MQFSFSNGLFPLEPAPYTNWLWLQRGKGQNHHRVNNARCEFPSPQGKAPAGCLPQSVGLERMRPKTSDWLDSCQPQSPPRAGQLSLDTPMSQRGSHPLPPQSRGTSTTHDEPRRIQAAVIPGMFVEQPHSRLCAQTWAPSFVPWVSPAQLTLFCYCQKIRGSKAPCRDWWVPSGWLSSA